MQPEIKYYFEEIQVEYSNYNIYIGSFTFSFMKEFNRCWYPT